MIPEYLKSLNVPKIGQRTPNKAYISAITASIMTIIITSICAPAWAEVTETSFITETSYFTRASCLKEGNSGIMANGKILNDNDLVAASWDFKLGDKLLISTLDGSKSVVCVVSDRGPSKRLYRRNRKLDLSARAFRTLFELRQGLGKVRVTKI